MNTTIVGRAPDYMLCNRPLLLLHSYQCRLPGNYPLGGEFWLRWAGDRLPTRSQGWPSQWWQQGTRKQGPITHKKCNNNFKLCNTTTPIVTLWQRFFSHYNSFVCWTSKVQAWFGTRVVWCHTPSHHLALNSFSSSKFLGFEGKTTTIHM